VPLYAFTPHASAGKKDRHEPLGETTAATPLIVDVIRLGDPHVTKQTLIHVTNSFLEAPLIVMAH
jgi:hypothetical protein